MGEGASKIKQEIDSFRHKFYLNLLLRGLALSVFFLLCYFLLAASIEYAFWLNSFWRALLLISFFVIVGFSYYRFLSSPFKWFTRKQGLSEEESAYLIGSKLPGVRDRLLNLVQLIANDKNDNPLAHASINQRSQSLEGLSFTQVIDLKENLKYLRFLAIPLLVILAIASFNTQVFTEGGSRIIQFNKEFVPQAPFSFSVDEQKFAVFRNEDLNLELRLDGNALPEKVLIVSGKRMLKMSSKEVGVFNYTFSKVQESFDIYFEAAGFRSRTFQVKVLERPELTDIRAQLSFPEYLQRKKESLNNVGNLVVPEGTLISWEIKAANTALANISFSTPNTNILMENAGNQLFKYSKAFIESNPYSISLKNEFGQNKEQISYQIEVIKDQFPDISLSVFKDSVAYRFLVFGGKIQDDYGLTELRLHYEIQRSGNNNPAKIKGINIPINKQQVQQSYYLYWPIDSLKLNPGDRLSYYLQVWDNDGVNGRKSSRTGTYQLSLPSFEAMKADISKSTAETEQSIAQSLQKAEEVKKSIEDSRKDLRGKQNLNWEDKKMIEDLLNQQEDLNQLIKEMQEKNKALENKKEALSQLDEKLKEQAEMLQKLLEDMLDEETRKLLEELQKLMEENADPRQLQRMLDQLSRNQNVLQKQLERSLELFKQLKYDYKLNESIKELEEQIARQQDLLDRNPAGDNQEQMGKEGKDTKSKDNKENATENTDNQNLAEEQSQLREDFNEWSESIKELEKLGKEIRKPQDLPGDQDMKNVDQEMKQSEEQLEQNNPSKAKPSQQRSLQQMQQMKEQMQQQQAGMQMEMDMMNLESMRHILHDLVKLSFDQEELFKEFTEVRQTDPRFVTLSQQQLKLQDDFKIISDSLDALAKRMFMLAAFLPREIETVNANLDKSMEELRQRRKGSAVQAMQFTMTSMNNLALLFDDMMQAMMEAMANAMPSMQQMRNQGKPQNISELQRRLNEEINELKESGKQGREMSEELARLAAEQERIRKAFQELEEKLNRDGEIPGSDLPGKMEQTELDLVNKQITEMTIRRQQEILTRLLESEKAMRERELDEERKGETAKEKANDIPKAFEEYLRLKEKELELLQTVPPKLYPYYKREVSDYFKRVGND